MDEYNKVENLKTVRIPSRDLRKKYLRYQEAEYSRYFVMK